MVNRTEKKTKPKGISFFTNLALGFVLMAALETLLLVYGSYAALHGSPSEQLRFTVIADGLLGALITTCALAGFALYVDHLVMTERAAKAKEKQAQQNG